MVKLVLTKNCKTKIQNKNTNITPATPSNIPINHLLNRRFVGLNLI